MPPFSLSREPDLVLYNGNIITLEDDLPVADSLAMIEGRIAAAGSSAEILESAGARTRKIDLQKRFVIPGFIDTHIHIISGGREMKKVQLGEVESIAEMLDVIRSHIESNGVKPGEWVVASRDWYVNQLKENRFPTRAELDQASPNNPVFIPRGGHQSAVNSLALQLAGITREARSPIGGEIQKGGDGEPTGVLIDAGQNPVKMLLPKADEDADQSALLSMRKLAHSYGITSLVEGAGSVQEWLALEKAYRSGQLKTRISARMLAMTAQDFDKVNSQLSPDQGDEWLRTGLIKMFLDGGSTGALFTCPYAGRPDFYGLQMIALERFEEISERANANNWRVSVHCNGDKAFDMLLDVWERINSKKSIAGRRWTIEHGKNIRLDQIERVKALGLIVTIQAAAAYVKGDTYIANFGRDIVESSSPNRSYLDAGVVLAGGSDWLTNPLNPFLHMYYAVARRTKSGTVLGAEQAISPKEALSMHTKYAAHLTFEENEKGSIAPGKWADLAVLSDDPLRVSLERIKEIKTLMTLVGGEIVYQAKDFRQ